MKDDILLQPDPEIIIKQEPGESNGAVICSPRPVTRSNGARRPTQQQQQQQRQSQPTNKIINNYVFRKRNLRRAFAKQKANIRNSTNRNTVESTNLAYDPVLQRKKKAKSAAKFKERMKANTELKIANANGALEIANANITSDNQTENGEPDMAQDLPIKKIKMEGEDVVKTEASKVKTFEAGHVVWAKFGVSRWWPAIVVNGDDCSQQPAREYNSWVVWFGDYKISELQKDRLVDFASHFKSKYSQLMGKAYMNSVHEAIEMCSVRCSMNMEDEEDHKLLEWAQDGFRRANSDIQPSSPNPDCPIPEVIMCHLKRIRRTSVPAAKTPQASDGANAEAEKTETSNGALTTDGHKPGASEQVIKGILKIQDICIACDLYDCEIVDQHPIFEGGLCAPCKNHVMDTMFAYGDDGTNSYCCICASPGELLICDNGNCSRVYCSTCIEHFVGDTAYDDILAMDPWHCYFCEDYEPKRNGLIRKKEDWQANVLKLFKPENQYQPDVEGAASEKRPIRVLSLFDGIGTGRLCLDQLGIEIEVYYSSEICEDSMNVSSIQHYGNIVQLGSVEKLTDVQIAKLCPIDLVIGGSPCNDLSLVNPARKGLYDPSGTGTLFFDFYRLLKAVELGNKGHFMFWLFENVASMPLDYRAIINRFLQCPPAMIDSKYFSPQNRARYFWGNIPGLHSPLAPYLLEQNIVLQSYVSPCCDRKALVDKVRTITTKSNSLKQRKDSVYPIRMKGVDDVLWVTELESVFGFPRHYTDTGYLNIGRRQHLLGKAWSVPVIKHIFTPLRNFFKLKVVPIPPSEPSTPKSTIPIPSSEPSTPKPNEIPNE